MPDKDNGFVQVHIIAFSTMFQGFFMSLRFAVLAAFLASSVMANNAWAYKVEKICEKHSCHLQRACLQKVPRG
jgi:hypothetical protein